MPDQDIVERLGSLLARHNLVPILGAGICRTQLGFAAPGLRDRLAAALTPPPDPPGDLAQVAGEMESRKGHEALVAELARHLRRAAFDDALSTAHLLAFSLDCGLIYTTNQDNLFELAAAKYGRPRRTVVTVADLADVEPGERLYIKFHANLAEPDSLVFTEGSYRRRLAEPDNFLDIRAYGPTCSTGGCCSSSTASRTVELKTRKSLDSMFAAKFTVPILIEHELLGLEKAAEGDVLSGLRPFRAAVDATQAPAHLQRRVAEVVVVIAEKVSNERELAALKAALFNLHLAPVHALLAMSAYMAACNIRKPAKGVRPRRQHRVSRNEGGGLAAGGGLGVEMLLGGSYSIGDGFRHHAMRWFENLGGLSGPARAFVEEQIGLAWKGCRDESPLARAAPLGRQAPPPFRRKRFADILRDVESSFPQQFPLPDRTL